ncbi:MAG: phage integrase SAM-like domain-containing protein [Dyadobacter sp.]|uniref:tyrosine-type recombinase/integrase n=1 Tax=Dyadobacter sp. TaxID=1914288 RepID=UPI003264FF3E
MAPTVSFFLRGRESAHPEKRCAIYAAIEFNGQKCTHFSTKIKIPTKYWMAPGSSEVKRSTRENPISFSYYLGDLLNEQLRSIQKNVIRAAENMEELELPLTAETIKAEYLNPRPRPIVKKVIEVVDELIAALRPKRKKQTMLTYRTRRQNLHEFLTAHGLSKLYIHDFSFDHFEHFQLWMIDYCSEDGVKRWCTNTINKHLTFVNKALKYGINKKYIRSNPIGEMGLEYTDTAPPEYLTPSMRLRLYKCDLVTLSREKDVAIFLYCTGLSYTDYLSLLDRHLIQVETGEWFIKKERDKSSIYSIIPLLPHALDVIQKYGGVEKLPRPEISDLNKMLKVLGDVCKIPFSLSTSSFRQTFSSMMENEYMVKPRTLMFMMGHTNERQLRNYSSVMPARVLHDLKKANVTLPFNLEKFTQLVRAS